MLSEFSRGILKTLEEASRPLEASAIADRMSEGEGREYVGSHVSVYLQHALQDYVQQTGDGKWIRAEQPEQGESFSDHSQQDESSDQNNSSQLTEELEGLSHSIIKILAESDEPLKARKIAEQLSDNSRLASQAAVNRRLYGVLEEFVHQDPQYRWSLRDGLHERFFDGTGEEDGNSRHEGHLNEKEESNSFEDLVAVVRGIMEGPVRPLKTREITNRVQSQGYDVIQSEIRDILHNHLDEEVYLIPNLGWSLQREVGLQKGEGEASSKAKKPLDAEEQEDADSTQESLAEAEGFSPNGNAAHISSHLETAKSLVTVLDLASRPLSASHLTAVLQKLGYQIEEEEVETCLHSVLSRFVSEDADSRFSLTPPKDSASPEVEQPVDADTRASFSGSVYTYEFVEGRHDGPTLFSSEVRGGTVRIELNASHPIIEHIRVLLDSEEGNITSHRHQDLIFALKILIAAWVDMESNLQGRPSSLAEELRIDWGRAVRLLLRNQHDA